MATEAEVRMTRFLTYDKASAQNSYSSHRGWRGNALRAVQSRIHDVRTLRTPTSVTKLHEAIDKYTKKCEDIEVCIERLMVIDEENTANSGSKPTLTGGPWIVIHRSSNALAASSWFLVWVIVAAQNPVDLSFMCRIGCSVRSLIHMKSTCTSSLNERRSLFSDTFRTFSGLPVNLQLVNFSITLANACFRTGWKIPPRWLHVP